MKTNSTLTHTQYIANQPRHTRYDTDAIKAHDNYKALQDKNQFKKPKSDYVPIVKMVGMIILGFALIALFDYILKHGGV